MKQQRSLLTEIMMFFLVGVLLTTCMAYFILKHVADSNVLREKETLSAGVIAEVENSIKEYDAYEWVMNYLLEHSGVELDLEYDTSEKTAVKESDFLKRHVGLVLTDVTAEQLGEFSEEDQQIFAEIVYNHWLSRLNDMKKAYQATFLYIVAGHDDYKEVTFIISASDGTRQRGTGPEDAFVLGMTFTSTDEQAEQFKSIKAGQDRLVYMEENIDRYRKIFSIGDINIVTGMSFSFAEVKREAEQQTFRSIIYFVLLQVALSNFCMLLISYFALRPLKKVRANVGEYALTKDSEKVRKQLGEIKSRNELGELADGVSEMIEEIDAYTERIRYITAEKERIGAELNVATQIQANMLPNVFPPFPGISQFDIYATMSPAKEVGGDFYDFFMLDKDHVALVMADVSGKGIPAALFMVVSKTLIKNRTMMGGTPSEILRDVNNQLCEGNELEYFVTVWMAIIDIHTGKGVAANAGHEHPVLRRANGRHELVTYRHSLALAAMEGMKFREHTFELEPGDRIFVYTDGVPEASNNDDELFGTDRMLESLNRDLDASPQGLLANLKEDMDAFVGTAMQFDDITMLVFDYYGDSGEKEL